MLVAVAAVLVRPVQPLRHRLAATAVRVLLIRTQARQSLAQVVAAVELTQGRPELAAQAAAVTVLTVGQAQQAQPTQAAAAAARVTHREAGQAALAAAA